MKLRRTKNCAILGVGSHPVYYRVYIHLLNYYDGFCPTSTDFAPEKWLICPSMCTTSHIVQPTPLQKPLPFPLDHVTYSKHPEYWFLFVHFTCRFSLLHLIITQSFGAIRLRLTLIEKAVRCLQLGNLDSPFCTTNSPVINQYRKIHIYFSEANKTYNFNIMSLTKPGNQKGKCPSWWPPISRTK